MKVRVYLKSRLKRKSTWYCGKNPRSLETGQGGLSTENESVQEKHWLTESKKKCLEEMKLCVDLQVS